MSSKNNRNKKKKKKRHPNPKAVEASLGQSKKPLKYFKAKGMIQEIGETTPHKHNMPEVIMEFIKDELEARTEQDEQRLIINAGINCWNIACTEDEQEMEKQLQKTLKKIPISASVEESMRRLIRRKVTHYSEYKYFIMDYEIKRTVMGTWHLSVSSFDFTQLAAMRSKLL